VSRPDAVGGTGRVVVVGMGSSYRRDDGAGPAVAEEVARTCPGVARLGPVAEPLDLLGLWDGADLVVVADAVRSGAAPGTVRLIELSDVDGATHGSAGPPGTTSTHGIGLTGVLRLARAVGNAPRRVVVVGIEGSEFGNGVGLSPAVEVAVSHAVGHVRELVDPTA
jgi:hydrogenase maturation protease